MATDERVVLVTGAARGIGAATAVEFARAGWRVAAADLRTPNQMSSEMVFALDVRDPASVERAVDAVVSTWGRIDALVNNAGVQRHGALEEFQWKDWADVLAVNLHGAFHCLQAVGRRMLEAGNGSIVNIVSIVAERGAAGRAPYAASKAALVSLTRTAAVEWAARGVRVNAVGPGYVDTDMVQTAVDAGALDTAPILARTPARRMAQPAEIAQAVRFLASPDAAFITGQVLYVDGGFLADYGVPWRRTI
jgi:3-oxoacyl-[acyl-carrier protein] reductase